MCYAFNKIVRDNVAVYRRPGRSARRQHRGSARRDTSSNQPVLVKAVHSTPGLILKRAYEHRRVRAARTLQQPCSTHQPPPHTRQSRSFLMPFYADMCSILMVACFLKGRLGGWMGDREENLDLVLNQCRREAKVRL